MFGLTVALSAAALTPVSVWSVAYQDGVCVLSRSFGDAQKPTIFAIRQIPLAGQTEILTLKRSGFRDPSFGTGAMTFGPSGIKTKFLYRSFSLPSGNLATSFIVDELVAEDFAAAAVIKMSFGQSGDINVAPTATGAGLRALADCKAGLMRQWGVDAAQDSEAMIPAQPINGGNDWLPRSAYPAKALKIRAGGEVIALWSIGTDGRAHDCRVVKSSGNLELDAASCTGIEQRARFKPAMGKDGKPMTTHAARRIIWVS